MGGVLARQLTCLAASSVTSAFRNALAYEFNEIFAKP
jgi:hypothetical protein